MDILRPDTPVSQSSDASQKSVRKSNQFINPASAAPTKRNWSNLVHQLPHFMHKYFADVIDVVGDGHCGLCAVSGLLGKLVEDHHIVRLELARAEQKQGHVSYDVR